MDGYFLILAVLGVAIVGAAAVRPVLRGTALSPPIVYLAVGVAVFALPLDLRAPQPGVDDVAAQRLTELVVIVSLMGAGLKLNRPLRWRAWSSTWRLLGIAMPLTIALVAALAMSALALPLASAVLLGAVLAPTDPVLASDVQVEGPTEEEDADDEVRFALTSEAGLNDAAAFPFTHLAIALAAGTSLLHWAVDALVVRLVVGLAIGWALGRVVAFATFRWRSPVALARTSEGFVAIGATLAVYGVTEIAHGYGFLAVFVAAVTIRAQERGHAYHQVLHEFAETAEHLASIVFLFLLGGAVVDGALRALQWRDVAIALAIIVVVRPLTGWLCLARSGIDGDERFAIAFFGVRGMGSIYYLAYAATEEVFLGANEVWAVAVLTIVCSVLLHGVTSTAVLRGIDRRRNRATALTASD